jgi:Ran GTPase-activating protein (RanGAP) involved in mRNA processing and transport
MGDRMGLILADSVQDLPFIQTINLCDNNLTDVSLGKIINSIITIETLTDLDLSENVIDGQAAFALAVFLGSSHCKLLRLIMKSANIDDDECSMFVTSLKKNHSLRELDLSYNLIGNDENLNSVKPDLITGSEALADLLESNTCCVSTLRLCWNMIRLDGAVTFATSLAVNSYLTLLDVSYNSLAEAGGEALGKALLTNNTLKELYLDHNGGSNCNSVCRFWCI